MLAVALAVGGAVIGVDILPEQRDLARAEGDQPSRLHLDIFHRARIFRAAGVGHDAKRTKPIAAFLDGEKRADAGIGRTGFRVRQMIELALDRKFRVDHAARFGAAQQFRQPMVILWPHNQIDKRRAAQ